MSLIGEPKCLGACHDDVSMCGPHATVRNCKLLLGGGLRGGIWSRGHVMRAIFFFRFINHETRTVQNPM